MGLKEVFLAGREQESLVWFLFLLQDSANYIYGFRRKLWSWFGKINRKDRTNNGKKKCMVKLYERRIRKG